MTSADPTGIDFEKAYEDALEQKLLAPGVHFLASNGDESFYLDKCLGARSLKEGVPSKPFDQDTFVRLASCTKLITSISVMQCVERGLLALDADIASVLPELKDKQIVSLTESGELVEKPSKNVITLRQLVTHSAGTSYTFFSPALTAWHKAHNRSPLGGVTVVEKGAVPLGFEPGTSWQYGIGLDWAGKAIARVTNQSLEEYMKANIMTPLGVDSITFWPQKRPDLMADLADMYARDPSTGLAIPVDHDAFFGTATEELGGGMAFARVRDYFKVLQAVLRSDARLLKAESWDAFFAPQLSPEAKAALLAFGDIPGALTGTDGHIDVPKYGLDHALGGMLCVSDIPGFKAAGTMHWGGYPLLEWWVDRKNGLCGFVACQMQATGDKIVDKLHDKFTRGVYEQYNAWKGENGK